MDPDDDDDDKDNDDIDDKDDGIPVWGIVIIVFIVVIFVFVLGGYLFMRHRNKKLENQLVDEYGKLDGTSRRSTN